MFVSYNVENNAYCALHTHTHKVVIGLLNHSVEIRSDHAVRLSVQANCMELPSELPFILAVRVN